MIENQNFNDAEEYFKEKYLKKSYSLDRLREALGLDVNISIKDLLLYTFGFISKIKNKDEIKIKKKKAKATSKSNWF